jgi:hypothetical protein
VVEQVSPVCPLAFSFLAARTTSIPDLSIVLFGKPTKGQHGAGVGFATLITRHNVNCVYICFESIERHSTAPRTHVLSCRHSVTRSRTAMANTMASNSSSADGLLKTFGVGGALGKPAFISRARSLRSRLVAACLSAFRVGCMSTSVPLTARLHACWATCHQRRWAL